MRGAQTQPSPRGARPASLARPAGPPTHLPFAPAPTPLLQFTQVAMLGGYIIVRDSRLRGQPHATWHGWSRDAFQGWWTYLR